MPAKCSQGKKKVSEQRAIIAQCLLGSQEDLRWCLIKSYRWKSASKDSKCMLFKYLSEGKELLNILRSYLREIVFV